MTVSETLASCANLPPEVQKHLKALEVYIGDTDGKDTVMWQTDPPNTCVDDGTIDAGEAVTAFNGIVAALIAALSEQVVVPKEPTPEMIAAWYRHKNGFHFAADPPPRDTSDYGAYRAMIAAAPASEATT